MHYQGASTCNERAVGTHIHTQVKQAPVAKSRAATGKARTGVAKRRNGYNHNTPQKQQCTPPVLQKTETPPE